MPLKIVINAKDFETLVHGGEVIKDDGNIILQDIGFDLMEVLIGAARKCGRCPRCQKKS